MFLRRFVVFEKICWLFSCFCWGRFVVVSCFFFLSRFLFFCEAKTNLDYLDVI